MTELALGEGANLSYVSVQLLGERAWHIGRLAARVARALAWRLIHSWGKAVSVWVVMSRVDASDGTLGLVADKVGLLIEAIRTGPARPGGVRYQAGDSGRSRPDRLATIICRLAPSRGRLR